MITLLATEKSHSPSTNEITLYTLHWRHIDHDGVSNHQPHGCLLNRLFRRRSTKTSKLRVTGLCVGKSPGPVNSPHKGPVTRKMFPFDDIIMNVGEYGMHVKLIDVHIKSTHSKPICLFNILRPRQNGHHSPEDTFKYIFMNENIWISIKTWLKVVSKYSINNILQLTLTRWQGLYLGHCWLYCRRIYVPLGLSELWCMAQHVFSIYIYEYVHVMTSTLYR